MPALRRAGAALTALFLLALSACAPAPDRTIRLSADLPTRAVVGGVPVIVQDDFHCGPAALAMVRQWAGAEVTQAEIAALAFSPGAEGTYISDMLGAARRQGQLAVEIGGFDALFSEIAAGHPVIVFQNLGLSWTPVWHYGVVVAYDIEADVVVLNSGANERMTMPLSLFRRTWERGDGWAMVVLPPDRLPVKAREIEVLRAAAGLERVGEYRAAEAAYRAGATRWTESWLWPFGLGNALYAQGRLGEARAAFARAVALDPDKPEARTNLATVTAEIAG